MEKLYGASACLYSGTGYGAKVEGAPSMVRQFHVVEETSRSYVLTGGIKVSKKTMVYNTGSFDISMFDTVALAIDSLRATPDKSPKGASFGM